jgi:hypothetical protein
VNLIDENDDFLRLGQFVEDRFHPFLELSAVFGARHHAAHVEGDDPFSDEILGNVPLDDPLGQSLDDGGFPHARFAEQHRLFFLRRERIWLIRSISRSLPMIGSSFP